MDTQTQLLPILVQLGCPCLPVFLTLTLVVSAPPVSLTIQFSLTLGKSASSLLVKSSLSTAEKGNSSASCVYLLGLFAQVRYGGCHDYEQIINGAWVVPWASVQGVAFFGPGD